MHSKWQIWDYFSSASKEMLASFEGALGISTFDPICLKLVKDQLLSGSPDRIVHHKLASEVTPGWLEEEFQTLSFFGGSECFFIHQCHEMKVDLLEKISSLDLAGRFIVLSFESENAAWKKFIKMDKISTLTIEAPRFWEPGKLLDFVCHHLKVPLSYGAKSWILDSLENDLGTFYNSCQLARLNWPDLKEIGIDEIKSLFVTERLDQFALASLYARKKFPEFFERLVMLEGDFDKMRGFFMFMQSHLIKLADVSYLSAKPRLSQYDKDIQSSSKLWKRPDIIREIDRFNEWELKCKKKAPLLWNEIREAQLKVLGRR